MTTSRAPRADAARNRAAILDAARDLLATDPHAPMTRIAEAAGVGRVTLYAHVESRPKLIAELLDAQLALARDAFAAAEGAPDASSRLRLLAEGSWRIVADGYGLLLAAHVELAPGEVLSRHGEVRDRLADLIAAGQRSGEFTSTQDAAWLAECILAMLHGLGGAATADDSPRIAATVLAVVGGLPVS